ncbi:MAG TPA: ANTAR domain-containing protein [Candidatus Angelobacter sp.]|nr:ANTAR domain-containing protein [Candidatus Angelobacter sp.]
METASGETVKPAAGAVESPEVDFLHAIGSCMAMADPLHEVLAQVVEFATAVVKCDSCFLYVLEGNDLVLRASKNPHPEAVGRLKLQLGQGITGWVAAHRQPVAVSANASKDPRFQCFTELLEDSFQSFLSVPVLSRNGLVGVINLQHQRPHVHNKREIKLVSTIGFLVGAAIEMARLENQNLALSERLETRKILERAKGILQRDLGLSEEQAYLVLQRESRQKRKPMREIADAIVLTEELKRSQQRST